MEPQQPPKKKTLLKKKKPGPPPESDFAKPSVDEMASLEQEFMKLRIDENPLPAPEFAKPPPPIDENPLLEPPPAPEVAKPPALRQIKPEVIHGFIVKGYRYVGLRHGIEPIFIKITGDYDPDEPPEAGPGWPVLIYEPLVIPDKSSNPHYYPQWISGKRGWLMENDMYNILLFDETRDYYHRV